jgi:hypothetical protein
MTSSKRYEAVRCARFNGQRWPYGGITPPAPFVCQWSQLVLSGARHVVDPATPERRAAWTASGIVLPPSDRTEKAQQRPGSPSRSAERLPRAPQDGRDRSQRRCTCRDRRAAQPPGGRSVVLAAWPASKAIAVPPSRPIVPPGSPFCLWYAHRDRTHDSCAAAPKAGVPADSV